jgi:hypothetical protein
MIAQKQKFERAIAAFDAANAQDPNSESVNGQPHPRELVYAQRMTDRLVRFAPDASETLQLAARCQHICRWTRPRADYLMTRAGYHRWRTALAQFHAAKAAAILQEAGYDEPTIARVRSLVRKENLKTDPEAQTLEDVICLVFLEHYFADFATKHDDEKIVGIVRKTWRKMSVRAQQQALKLPLDEGSLRLVARALEA